MLKIKDRYVVAVAGASGAIGNEIINILEEREFPVERLRLFDTDKSVGEDMDFEGSDMPVEPLEKGCFNGIDVVFFAAGPEITKAWIAEAVSAGCVVIDCTSFSRMSSEVPLVVPEVNASDLSWHKGVVANPSGAAIQLSSVLKPLHDAASVKRVVVTMLQAVSATSKSAMDELFTQTSDLLSFKDVQKRAYPHQIAFNLLPHVGQFADNDYTKEELRALEETKKILKCRSLTGTVTAVRVPVFRGLSECVNIETERKLTVAQVKELLASAAGITVFDAPSKNIYPFPLEASGRDDIFAGRIREDESIACGINIWTVTDNLRKGSALNAVQIAEELIKT
ncbi:MAG: aspartate-semialdehyde dehydrogenase [Nitrospirae bacterium]|nr:aspartate-semialdehyde dehydrogenase [Nitrospirota bacterium]